MKVPAVAKRTFNELSSRPEYMAITQFILEKISRISSAIKRAKFIHQTIDDYNQKVFSHPLVLEFSPCKLGCSACCHTQVSVTADEAQLLAQRVQEGVEIDMQRLASQSRCGNDSSAFYQLSYEERKCVFLDDSGACNIYEDRPAVCRTNAVLGEPSQCETTQGGQLRLVKTAEADMAIYAAYLFSHDSGALPLMLNQALQANKNLSPDIE